MTFPNLKLISAGAGSGKTYRLTQELTKMLASGTIRPEGIIATTFTRKAAAELKERVRVSLLREGASKEANLLTNALIGTVHGLGIKLLKRFAFEAGVSPRVDIIAEGDEQRLFNLSLAAVLDVDDIGEIEGLCERLGLSESGEKYNWRKDILGLVEVIRANNFSDAIIAQSRDNSWSELAKFLPSPATDKTLEQYHTQLLVQLTETANALLNNEADGTKKTQSAATTLFGMSNRLRQQRFLPWSDHAKLADFGRQVGKKSEELVDGLVQLATSHPTLPAFQDDIRRYQNFIYDYAARAIKQYDDYKKSRGRIDYTDMEVLVLKLLDNPGVKATLSEELDLLMVDEFQDTSPIQLAIFIQLSALANHSIWVGDPKQSIYGFRGAEPRLMAAVMAATGPIDENNIQTTSYRSREDIVYACNSLFVSAFPEMEDRAISLEAFRSREKETPEQQAHAGLHHWHFELDGKGYTSLEWQRNVLAKAIRELLADPPPTAPKGEHNCRPLRPGDIAILCRSNYGCRDMATALNRQGLSAAIARTGLLETAEAALLLACLRFLLNGNDTLSVAEVLYLGDRWSLDRIIDDRLADLEIEERHYWADGNELIAKLNLIRKETREHSASEVLNLLLERLDLRRRIVAWGDGEQRLSNVDELRRLAVTYEENCHRLHRSASLGGFLLDLDRLKREEKDNQGASERPEAVNVLTYHRSKGLEWPAVICFDLNQKLRATVWGRDIVATKEAVDLNKPLADRWLRYWVSPYGKRINPKLPWIEALNESEWQKKAEEAARAEEARLLYVGFTRARDYLILPTEKKGAAWVDRVFARGGNETIVLEPSTSETPFTWKGRDIDKRTQVWKEPKNLPGSEPTFTPIPFIRGERPGRQVHTHAVIDDDYLIETFGGSSLQPQTYFSWPAFDPATDERYFNQLAAAFYHADLSQDQEMAGRLESAEQLFDNFRPGGVFDPEQLLESADALRTLLAAKLGRYTLTQHLPLHFVHQQRHYRERLDWLLETDAGCYLIKDSTMPLSQIKRQEAKLSAELHLLTEAVTQLTGKTVIGAAILQPYSGTLLEL